MLAAFSAAFFIFSKIGIGFTAFSYKFSSVLLKTTTALSSPRLIFFALSSAIKTQAIMEVRLIQIIAVTAYALKIFILIHLNIFIHE